MSAIASKNLLLSGIVIEQVGQATGSAVLGQANEHSRISGDMRHLESDSGRGWFHARGVAIDQSVGIGFSFRLNQYFGWSLYYGGLFGGEVIRAFTDSKPMQTTALRN